ANRRRKHRASSVRDGNGVTYIGTKFDRRMKRVTIPGVSIATTQLGYGCSQLMGGITRRQSLKLLETAFDVGIRHFDTAPSYGLGEGESALGSAFRSRRDQITITTKFGIRPPRKRSLIGIARYVAIPVFRLFP